MTVSSQSEKNAAKLARKVKQNQYKLEKNIKQNDLPFASLFEGFDGEYLKDIRAEQLATNASAPLFSDDQQANPNIKYPHVYDHSSGGSVLSVFGTRFRLPSRSEMIDDIVSFILFLILEF